MFSNKINLNKVFYSFIQAIKRFPLAILVSFIITLISIYLIEVDLKRSEALLLYLSKIIFTGTLAFFIFTASSLFVQNFKTNIKVIVNIFAFLLVLIYYYVLPNNIEELLSNFTFSRHIYLSLLFLISFFWTPYIFVKITNEEYWNYSKKILFSLVITSLFTLIVIIGINTALYASDKLFDLDILGKRYLQLDLFIIGYFSISYFLSLIPKQDKNYSQIIQNSKLESFFTKFLLTPLSILYFVILYAYSFKVIFSFIWPKSILSWLIITFSFIAILTYLFWTSFLKENLNKYTRWIWLAVLIQTLMLFSAIYIRVNEYAWTQSRYMVFALGLWLAFISLYFLFFKKARIKWIFISLSFLILITQIGPINSYKISKNSQITRLQNMITQTTKYKNSKEYPLKLRYEISDIINYLHTKYKDNSLEMIFPKIVKEHKKLQEEKLQKINKINTYLPHFIVDKLGFEYLNYWTYKSLKNKDNFNIHFSIKQNSKKVISTKGYDYLYKLYLYQAYNKKKKKDLLDKDIYLEALDLSINYTKDSQLNIKKNNSIITINIKEFMQNLINKYGKESKRLVNKDLSIEKQNKDFKIKIELSSINKHVDKDTKYIELKGWLFIK